MARSKRRKYLDRLELLKHARERVRAAYEEQPDSRANIDELLAYDWAVELGEAFIARYDNALKKYEEAERGDQL